MEGVSKSVHQVQDILLEVMTGVAVSGYLGQGDRSESQHSAEVRR